LRLTPTLTLKHRLDHLPLTFGKHICATGRLIITASGSDSN
jgi:hypothetical protein